MLYWLFINKVIFLGTVLQVNASTLSAAWETGVTGVVTTSVPVRVENRDELAPTRPRKPLKIELAIVTDFPLSVLMISMKPDQCVRNKAYCIQSLCVCDIPATMMADFNKRFEALSIFRNFRKFLTESQMVRAISIGISDVDVPLSRFFRFFQFLRVHHFLRACTI